MPRNSAQDSDSLKGTKKGDAICVAIIFEPSGKTLIIGAATQSKITPL
jgi:hypothetical protein